MNIGTPLLEALSQLLSAQVVGLMLVGIVVGLIVGFLPGLGSLLALALLLPFAFGLSPFMAFALLLGMYASATVASDLTAILFSIPGQPDSAAVILDGFPLAQQGKAEQAMGASVASSAIGGVIGAAVLALLLPLMRPLVLSIGPPEVFMLTLLGATIIGSVSGRSTLKGLAVAGLGFLLAAVGTNALSGINRYTFGTIYLIEGLPIVPVSIGLFAMPELIRLHRNRATIAGLHRSGESRASQGVLDALHHRGALIRGSILGVTFGMLPGVGGPAGQWAAYGSAKFASKHPEDFGRGAMAGVVAASASNNSKEGGQLVPTLAFGIPGGPAMAVLLGAFLILGLRPGPDMLGQNLSVTIFMVLVLIIGNVAGALIVFPFLKYLARISFIRSELLFPFVLGLAFIGAMATTGLIGDLALVVVTGLVAYAMQQAGWPIVPLVVGFVLGEQAEPNLALSINAYDGAAWLLRPSVLLILAGIVVALFLSVRTQRRASRALGDETGDGPSFRHEMLVGWLLMAVSIAAFVIAWGWPSGARIYPQVIATGIFTCVAATLVRSYWAHSRAEPSSPRGHAVEPPALQEPVLAGMEAQSGASDPGSGHVSQAVKDLIGVESGAKEMVPIVSFVATASAVAWIIGTAVAIWVFGVLAAVGLCTFGYLRWVAHLRLVQSAGLGILTVILTYAGFFKGLGIPFPTPLLTLVI